MVLVAQTVRVRHVYSVLTGRLQGLRTRHDRLCNRDLVVPLLVQHRLEERRGTTNALIFLSRPFTCSQLFEVYLLPLFQDILAS